MRKGIAIIAVGLLLFACKSREQVTQVPAEPVNPPPAWVSGRPISSVYYVGIGVASKRANPLDFAQIAKRNALSDLTSEISTTVSSHSILQQLEQDDHFQEDYQSSVMLSSTKQVEGYETMGSWENDSEYWIYYRLSKEEYQAARQRKIDLAAQKGLNFYTAAREKELQNNYAAALVAYFQALEAVHEHFAEPLEVRYDDQNIYLGNAILSGITQIMGNMILEPIRKDVKIMLGESLNQEQIGFSLTTSKGSPLASLPVKYSMYSGKRTTYQVAYTDRHGNIACNLGKVRTVESPREVRAIVDLDNLVNRNNTLNKMVAQMIPQFESPFSQAFVRVERPLMWISSNESDMGIANDEQRLYNAFRKAATDQGFALTPDRSAADLVIDIVADTRKGGISFDMYSSFLDGTVAIRNGKDGTLIYQENLSEIKGIQLDYDKASDKAYQKASGIIEERVFPTFFKQYLR